MSSFLTLSPHLSFLILPPPVCLLSDMIGPSYSPPVSSYSRSSEMLVLLRLTLSLFVPVSLYFFLGVQPLHWVQLLPTHCLQLRLSEFLTHINLPPNTSTKMVPKHLDIGESSWLQVKKKKIQDVLMQRKLVGAAIGSFRFTHNLIHELQ